MRFRGHRGRRKGRGFRSVIAVCKIGLHRRRAFSPVLQHRQRGLGRGNAGLRRIRGRDIAALRSAEIEDASGDKRHQHRRHAIHAPAAARIGQQKRGR